MTYVEHMLTHNITPAQGRLGVLLPGMGAVASTFMAGVMAARRGIHPPIGSVSQMANIRLGKREENRNPLIRDFVSLASLDDLVFGGWDPISPNAMEAAKRLVCCKVAISKRWRRSSKALLRWKPSLTRSGYRACRVCESKPFPISGIKPLR